MGDDNFPQIMYVHEVANNLRVSRATIYRLAQAGKIPYGKVGRAWRFRKEAIDSWISEQPDSKINSTWPGSNMLEGIVIDDKT